MPNNEMDSAGDEWAPDPPSRRPPEAEGTFPTNAVVGIIDDPRQLRLAVEELRTAGFDPSVLHGKAGEERIHNAGDSPRDLRMMRLVQGAFGYEAEHTERHMEEVEAGHYLLIVESHDDVTTERAREIFAAHGGRFVNYYSRWTSRTLHS